jgi:hypothetical protein
MTKSIKSIFYFLVVTVLLISCNNTDEEETPLGDFESGYFILNEGGTALSAPVTHVAEDETVTDNPFENVNGASVAVGTFLQDLFFNDEFAFVTSGSANSVTIFNRFSLEFETTITDNFENPRYGLVYNNKAYVTNSGSFMTTEDDFLTIIDLTDYSTTKVVIGKVANRIEEANGLIYITNGDFNGQTSIAIVNPNNLDNITFLDFGSGNVVNTFEVKDNFLYVLAGSAPGKIFKVNTSNNTIDSSIDIPVSITSPKNLDIDDNIAYFTSGTSVYNYELGSNTIATTPIVTYESTSAFGATYGFAVNDGVIYIADAGDFASSGTAFEYDLSGNLLKTISTGVAPNSFHFNE